MTLKEAEIVSYTLKTIKDTDMLDVRIQKLFKEGKHEEIAQIALELNGEIKRMCKDKLSSFPSLLGEVETFNKQEK